MTRLQARQGLETAGAPTSKTLGLRWPPARLHAGVMTAVTAERTAGVAAQESPFERALLTAVTVLRSREGALVLPSDGPDRPDMILIDRRAGLHTLEFEMAGSSADDRAPFVRLNRKRAELRESLGELADHGIGGAVVLGSVRGRLLGTEAAAGRAVLSVADLQDPEWPDRLPSRPLDDEVFHALSDLLAPAAVFTGHRRLGTVDPGQAHREQTRVQLDAWQASTALGTIEDVLMLEGPPGSGKTLVLAARARHLAYLHPDWRIGFLMYNRALAPYIAALVGNCPNVTVRTFGKFAYNLGFCIDLYSSETAAEDYRRAQGLGIPRQLDALLIDEVQDFDSAWLQFALDTVRPGRGGSLLAGDTTQSLYRESGVDVALRKRRVEYRAMTQSYRSTRPIMQAAAALMPGTMSLGSEGAPDGEPVELVWAESRDEQAACVAWEIRQMIESGTRQPEDVGVLVTQRFATVRRLCAALGAQEIPYVVIDRTNADFYDPSSRSVKLITVHSAKGHEFPVVALFGLEALPDGEDGESLRRRRVGFVGMTRAKDQLLLTYTRDNVHIRRLLAVGSSVRHSTWPDDYGE